MKRSLSLATAAVLALGLSACMQSSPTPARGSLTITGRAASADGTFAPTQVEALRGGAIVSEAPVAADGSFSLRVPAGSGYQLMFAHAGGSSTLVFPRQLGTVGHRFNVLGHGTFDLGSVRHIGDPALRSFHFSGTRAALTAPDSAAASAADGDDVQCEDGVDPTTGAVCVDDDATDSAGTCEEAEASSESERAESGDEAGGVDCRDGLDPSGAPCDGGPAANPTGGVDDGAEGATAEHDAAEDDATPTDAVVADHNLPDSAGCGADAEDDGVDCQDGIDPATGAECDGGPAANSTAGGPDGAEA